MFKIEGNSTEIREWMKTKRAETAREIRKLEKKNYPTTKLGRQLIVYSVSKTLPVEFDGMIINGKLLLDFYKKLDANWVDFKVDHEHKKVILHYRNAGSGLPGILELCDLFPFFTSRLSSIPKLVVS